MKLHLADVAAKRLAEHRQAVESGPLRTAQKALFQALLRGDLAESLRQSDIVRAIRGPQPPSPLALKLIERINRLIAQNALAGGQG